MSQNTKEVLSRKEEQAVGGLVQQNSKIKKFWFHDNVFKSSFFDAGSALVSDAERFVVDTVKLARPHLKDNELKSRADCLMHEETMHSEVHDAYNEMLRNEGYKFEAVLNFEKWLMGLFQKHCSLRTRLAMCVCIEHFTATMAKQLLERDVFYDKIDVRMKKVWVWHALEELDHRSTAFDVYTALGGGYVRRSALMLFMTVLHLSLHGAALIAFLAQNGALFRRKTFAEGFAFTLGKEGLHRNVIGHWFTFFKFRFHPGHIPIEDRFNNRVHHYHIADELMSYFPKKSV